MPDPDPDPDPGRGSTSEDRGCCEDIAPQNPCLGPSRAWGTGRGAGGLMAWDLVPCGAGRGRRAGTGLGATAHAPRCSACSACTRPAGRTQAGGQPSPPPPPPTPDPCRSVAENGTAHHTCGCGIYGEPISSSATRSISERSNKPHSRGINLDREAADEKSRSRAAVFQPAGQNPYPGGFLGASRPRDVRVLRDIRVPRDVGDVQRKASRRCLEAAWELGRN